MNRFKPQHLITTKSYNELINRFSLMGFHEDVLQTYSSMLSNKTYPDAYTFPSLLKACTSLGLISHGLLIHQHTIVNGYSSDAYIATSIVHMYSKLGQTYLARKVFDEMSERNVVPWSAIIGCYSRVGDVEMAFCMLNEMRLQGIQPNSVTLLGLLVGILEVRQLLCVQACVFRLGLECVLSLMNSFLNLYGKCGRVDIARSLFESMDEKDIVSWNSMVSGYSQNGYASESIELLNRMRIEGMRPDHQTFGSVVSSVASDSRIQLGKLIHGQIVKAGFISDMHVDTTLIAMYLKFGNVGDAFRLFDGIVDGDVVTWTAIISGLVQNDKADEALHVFRKMLQSGVCPSTATIASALAACAQLASFGHGSSIHGYVVRQKMVLDMALQNSLITMYAKCGHLEQSWFVFDRAFNKDVVTWNAIVAGYAHSGRLDEALILFEKMRVANERPDFITVVSLLQACASLGALQQGKLIHNFVIRNGTGRCISIDTALTDMYSKCGDLFMARKCFDEMPEQDVVSWSTIIAGYGSHGKGETALKMYYESLHSGIEPNYVIFLAVLSACSHAGFVSEGLRIFNSMSEDFRMEPKLEHRACIVDLLSRSGRVQEAYDFVKRMFQQPNIDVMGILLDACRAYKYDDLGDVISREIVALKPESAGNYVQLVHSYASMGRWDDVGEAWMQMRSLGLKKVPGWSSIELHGIIATFFVDHTSHSQYEEIMLMLKILGGEMQDTKTDPKTNYNEILLPEKLNL
ncbi:hypothetical protein AQUCO_04100160v1 [Aquilegia coerulea]|uniref:Pentacotripeptide-repeat region of PRORP domain-containing protein n=1 Tax=Aquilegia coerulea TaxID=218851 RepID=A0A2G5CQH2_AQUCA|nr:hypothetical protein AQUCO_04100160v1 [Aquilegia coerulea]